VSVRNRTAIVGVGETEFSRNAGRSNLQLALEAISKALADAGLQAKDVDGIVKMHANTDLFEIDIARSLGINNLRFFSEIPHGGGGSVGTVVHAAAAIASGQADVVVCFRSIRRSLRPGGRSRAGRYVEDGMQYRIPVGLVTPAQWVAMFARRYLNDFGLTTEAFGLCAVEIRNHGASNPHAMHYGRTVTLEDHQRSRWITEPLRLLDNCLETDGGSAVVVVSAEKARELQANGLAKHAPVFITGAAQGTGSRTESMTSYQRDSLSVLEEATETAREVYRIAELEPSDIDTLQLYDHFTPMVLMTLEAYGFAEPGKASELFRLGRTSLNGDIPLNTHGGQLADGYLHGFSMITEAARQIRGDAQNQVEKQPRTALATAGTGVPTSALILSADSA
jgi:acetyl-CoA acetyltransferase